MSICWDQAQGQTDTDAPCWPLSRPDRFLTSNFMEYREGRFHAGLDLKTDSRCGFPVYAAEDGWISRVRAGPTGYGRAVYLQGTSGRTYVYGHLDRFADSLRAVIEAAQQQQGRYRVDLTLPVRQLPIRRGEVLGLSGQSGTTGPHLHFEVRNRRQEPLNPLACGFAVPDTFAPRILKIRALPAEAQARVAGGLVSCSVSAADGLSGELPPLPIQGAVAFTAELVDASDICDHLLAPYRIEVHLDGARVFGLRNDRFAWSENNQMRLEWLVLDDVRECWLLRRPVDLLPGRKGTMWAAQPGGLSPGSHQVELTVADWAGNQSVVAWQLLVATGIPRSEMVTAWQPDPIGLELPATSDGKDRWLTPFLVLVQESADSLGAMAALNTRDLDAPGWDGRELTASSESAVQRLMFGPAKDPAVMVPATLWVVPDSLNEDEQEFCAREQGLHCLGPAARFITADWPVREEVSLSLPGPPRREWIEASIAVYRQAADSTWQLQAPPEFRFTDASRFTWSFPLTSPGRHALLQDRTPPQLGTALNRILVGERQERQRAGIQLSRWEFVVIPAADTGAGIDPDSWRATLAGQPLIVEPDSPRQQVLIELPDSLAEGQHRLVLEVCDRARHRTRRHFDLICQSRE
jgi:hypothetical protein